MGLWIYIAWAVGVSAFTLIGSLYARRYNRPDLLVGLYVGFLIAAQVLATKVAVFDFGFTTVVGPAGVLVFSVTFLLTDVVNEWFGKGVTKHMILIGLLAQIAVSFFLYLGTALPSAPFWAPHDEAWGYFFGLVPRIMAASWIAFYVSENVDASIYAAFKKRTAGRHLWMRNVFSTAPALALDSLIFVPLAFWGTPDLLLWPMVMGQVATKWIVSVVDIPFMYLNRAVLEHKHAAFDQAGKVFAVADVSDDTVAR